MMKIVPLLPKYREEWDRIADGSDDAWFFHRYDWVAMSQDLWDLEQKSFLLEHEGKLIGICPLQLRLPSRSLRSQYMGTGGPALLNGVPEGLRKKALKFIHGHIRETAQQYDSPFIEISLSPLSPASFKNTYSINPLIHYSYDDTSTHTWIVDLRPSQEAIVDRYTDDARRSIKKSQELGYTIERVEDAAAVERYYEVHCETMQRTGAETHPKRYFAEVYERLCRTGAAVMWEAKTAHGETAAFEINAIFKQGVLYWMGCSKTAHLDSGINYWLQHHAIMWAKSQGAVYFESGEAFPNAKEAKLRGLSGFKGKFGGELHRYFKGTVDRRILSRPGVVRQWGRTTLELLKPVLKDEGVNAISDSLRKISRSLDGVRRLRRRWSRVSYLCPSWEKEDVMSILISSSTVHADRVGELRKAFKRLLSTDGEVYPTSSGRAAFELALRVIKEKCPGKHKFMVTTYGCRGVFDPLKQAGFEPLLVDIDGNFGMCPKSFQRLLQKNSDIAGVLIPHLGGCVMRPAAIVQAARERGLIVIDDACQSLGVRHNGMYVGAQQEMAIFSFGAGKCLNATAGGMLVSCRWHDELNAVYERLPQEPDAVIRRRGVKMLLNYFLRLAFDLTPEILSSHRCQRMHSLDAALVLRQLEQIDALIGRQQANAKIVIEELARMKVPFHLQPADGHIYTKLSVIFHQPEDQLRFVRVMDQAGIETEPMYTPLHLRDLEGECAVDYALPNSERLYRNVVNVPVRPNLTQRELKRILEAIGRAKF